MDRVLHNTPVSMGTLVRVAKVMGVISMATKREKAIAKGGGGLVTPGQLRRAEVQATIASIAREILHIETLETRRSDSLDFHDVAVWQVKAALEAAYTAGQRAGR